MADDVILKLAEIFLELAGVVLNIFGIRRSKDALNDPVVVEVVKAVCQNKNYAIHNGMLKIENEELIKEYLDLVNGLKNR